MGYLSSDLTFAPHKLKITGLGWFFTKTCVKLLCEPGNFKHNKKGTVRVYWEQDVVTPW